MLMATSRSYDEAPSFAQAMLAMPQFSALIEEIYQGPTEDVPWGTALETMRRLLGGSHATLILRPPAADRPGLMINAAHDGITPAAASYNNYYYSLDPIVNLPADRVTTADELFGAEKWLSSEIYKQFLRDLDIRYVLAADIRTEDGVECRFRVSRGHTGEDFGVRERALLSILLPHLKRAVDLHSRLDLIESERTLYANTVDRMLVGTVILDDTGTILKTNAAAQEILSHHDGIRINNGAFDFNYAQEQRQFQKMIKQMLAPQPAGAVQPAMIEAMSITRPSGKAKLGLLIRAIPFAEWSEENKWRPACVVFIRDPECRSDASREVMRKLFDFTPAETSLALLMANGYSVEDAADDLGISKNTARAHLRAIFSKTGVTRQATLVRTLLSSVISLG
ncbi:helix-turn-helix transcriptional regulator [Pandoraea terrae]|uniref:Helix-turn-helix transcriptional regulator n=1 Tax=Pandoraea terrae TaxID=1537710 RepID=A0A5E4ZAQ7_9BURK|nr:helix-turn-helix transcriptional regulator [Pandoraea terrae]VVE58451.1 helix-turn-helix transcriptional regulator [Pandoraea terrae]